MAEELTPEEIDRLRDEVVKRMLNTPPQPRRSKKKPSPSSSSADPAGGGRKA